jgi:hypothetical protein
MVICSLSTGRLWQAARTARIELVAVEVLAAAVALDHDDVHLSQELLGGAVAVAALEAFAAAADGVAVAG